MLQSGKWLMLLIFYLCSCDAITKQLKTLNKQDVKKIWRCLFCANMLTCPHNTCVHTCVCRYTHTYTHNTHNTHMRKQHTHTYNTHTHTVIHSDKLCCCIITATTFNTNYKAFHRPIYLLFIYDNFEMTLIS